MRSLPNWLRVMQTTHARMENLGSGRRTLLLPVSTSVSRASLKTDPTPPRMTFWPVTVSNTEKFMVMPSTWASHTDNLRDYTGTNSTEPLNMLSMERKFVGSGSLKNGLGMVR